MEKHKETKGTEQLGRFKCISEEPYKGFSEKPKKVYIHLQTFSASFPPSCAEKSNPINC